MMKALRFEFLIPKFNWTNLPKLKSLQTRDESAAELDILTQSIEN